MAQFNSDFRSSPGPGNSKSLISSFANLTKSNKEILNSKLFNNSEYSNGSFKLKSNSNSNNNYTSDIEKELTDLTLSIGKYYKICHDKIRIFLFKLFYSN